MPPWEDGEAARGGRTWRLEGRGVRRRERQPVMEKQERHEWGWRRVRSDA